MHTSSNKELIQRPNMTTHRKVLMPQTQKIMKYENRIKKLGLKRKFKAISEKTNEI